MNSGSTVGYVQVLLMPKKLIRGVFQDTGVSCGFPFDEAEGDHKRRSNGDFSLSGKSLPATVSQLLYSWGCSSVG